MPATAEAWAAGELGADHVDLLADAASNGRGDLFQRDETMLVNHCLELTWGQLGQGGALLDVPRRRRTQP